jgi:hypothetical protein
MTCMPLAHPCAVLVAAEVDCAVAVAESDARGPDADLPSAVLVEAACTSRGTAGLQRNPVLGAGPVCNIGLLSMRSMLSICFQQGGSLRAAIKNVSYQRLFTRLEMLRV